MAEIEDTSGDCMASLMPRIPAADTVAFAVVEERNGLDKKGFVVPVSVSVVVHENLLEEELVDSTEFQNFESHLDYEYYCRVPQYPPPLSGHLHHQVMLSKYLSPQIHPGTGLSGCQFGVARISFQLLQLGRYHQG